MTGKEKNRVEELIPEGLLEIAEPFIAFLKKYYEFMNQDEYSPSTIINRDQLLRSFQVTSDLFLQRLYNEVGASYYINKANTDADIANLLANLNLLYEAKGSLESVKVLFKIIFGEEVDVYLPRDFILKPSDGDWSREYSFMAELISGDPTTIVGNYVTITSRFPNRPEQTVTAEVVRLDAKENGLYEVVIPKESINVLYFDATITYNDVELRVKPILNTLLYQSVRGTEFSFSQAYPVINYDRNWVSEKFTASTLIVPSGTVTTTGDSSLDVSSTTGLEIGDYVWGDSALATNTTITGITDSDTITLSNALLAPLPTGTDVLLSTAEFPDSYAGTLSLYFDSAAGTRQYRSTNPAARFEEETFTIYSTTDGLRVEKITRPTENITKLYYDQTIHTLTTNRFYETDCTFSIDSSLPEAQDVTVDWDNVIEQFASTVIGDSATLSTFFNTNPGFTLVTDSDAGNIADSSTNIFVTSTAGLRQGYLIEGTGIDSDTFVTSVVDSAQLTINNPHSGLSHGATLNVNNYARGDINRDGVVGLDDVELFVRRIMSFPNEPVNYNWIRSVIELQLDSAGIAPLADSSVGSGALIRPQELGDSDSLVEWKFQTNGYDYPEFFVGVLGPGTVSGRNSVAVYQSNPIALSNAQYRDNKGFLSDTIKLQDGDFYQDFSYVIRSDTLLSEFEDILYKTVHPSGLKAFGELVAGQNVTVTTDFSDAGIRILYDQFQDKFTAQESSSRTVRKPFDDSATATGVLNKRVGKEIADEVLAFSRTAYYAVDYAEDGYATETEDIVIRLNGVVQ